MFSMAVQFWGAGCVSIKAPDLQIAESRGARVGVYWYSGLNSDQASAAVTRELVQAGYRVADTTPFNLAMHRLEVNPAQMSQETLRKVRQQTGVEYLLVGSSFPLPGLFDIPRAGMSLHLIDVREGRVLWKEVAGNSLFSGVSTTEAHVNKGAASLVHALDSAWGEQIKGAR